MSTSFLQAADDARRLLRGFRAFEEVAQALDAAGLIEQRTAEAQRTFDELQPKIEAARAELADAYARIDRAQAEGRTLISEATAAAAETTRAARVEAQRLADATEEAAKEREAQAAKKVKEADVKVASAAQVRDAIAAEVEALESRLAAAKASAAKLLG
jgi:chromosome segregation ATPase